MHIALKTMILATTFCSASFAFADGHGMKGMPKGDITKAEFLKKTEARFDQVDTNKDGVLTEAERKAAHQKMKSHRAEMRAKRASAAAAK